MLVCIESEMFGELSVKVGVGMCKMFGLVLVVHSSQDCKATQGKGNERRQVMAMVNYALFRIGFTAREICALMKISVRQLNEWTSSGLVVPSVYNAQGRGRMKVYGIINLLQVRTIRELTSRGINLGQIKKAVVWIRDNIGEQEPLATSKIVAYEDSIFWIQDVKEFQAICMDVLKTPGMVIMIPIGELYKEVVDIVKEYKNVA